MRPQQPQQPRHPRRPPPPTGLIARRRTTEVVGYVAVAKALQPVVAPQHRPEQALLLHAEQVQPTAPTAVVTLGLAGAAKLLLSCPGRLHRGQGLQVAVVGGPGHVVVVVEVGHALVHGAPSHLPAPVAAPQPTDFELARLVDDGLDPQYLAELVVHLQPVALDVVLDAG